jgi:hypothetical protein
MVVVFKVGLPDKRLSALRILERVQFRRQKFMKKTLIASCCALFLCAGIGVAQVVVHEAPPPRHVEKIPPPPAEHRDWAWHEGYYRHDGQQYVWVPGVYVEPPHPGAHWVDGHWDHHGGGYVWVEGSWR